MRGVKALTLGKVKAATDQCWQCAVGATVMWQAPPSDPRSSGMATQAHIPLPAALPKELCDRCHSAAAALHQVSDWSLRTSLPQRAVHMHLSSCRVISAAPSRMCCVVHRLHLRVTARGPRQGYNAFDETSQPYYPPTHQHIAMYCCLKVVNACSTHPNTDSRRHAIE